MTTYRSAPAFLCNAPSKTFPDAQEAHRHAREAASAHRVAYVVWSVRAGRPSKLAAYSPNPARA